MAVYSVSVTLLFTEIEADSASAACDMAEGLPQSAADIVDREAWRDDGREEDARPSELHLPVS